MYRFRAIFRGLCPARVFFALVVLGLALAQPVLGQTRYSFGDRVPSFTGGYYLNGVPSSLFLETNETRFQMAGRVLGEGIGGVPGVAQDLANIALFPAREPVLFGAAALGVGLLVANDYALTTAFQDRLQPAFAWFKPQPFLPRQGTILNNLSYEDQYILAGIALGYAYGFAVQDERAQVAAVLSAKAVAYSYLISHVALKPVFGRQRPVQNLSAFYGPTRFTDAEGLSATPFSWGNSVPFTFGSTAFGTSFPSFHYTLFFSVARVYSGVYDNAWLPYVAAGVVSLANLDGHRHWVSDMVAGALIGTVIGQAVLDSYHDRKSDLNMRFTPVVSSKGVGAQFSMQF